MKKLLFLGACLVALASQPARAQTGGAEIVVMQVRENGYGNVRVVLAYPGGKTEEQEFKAGFTNKAQDESASEYQKLITKLYQQGYTLKSTFGPGNGALHTLIFVKGQ
jgi:hypothetical protein